MIFKIFIGFVAITTFAISLIFIEFVFRKIKNLILKTSFGECYLNNIKSSVDDICIALAGLIVFGAIITALWQLGTWIIG